MDESKQRGQYSLAAGVAVAAKLAAEGHFIFTTQEARRVAAGLGMPTSGVGMMLSRLTGTGWIVRLRRGLYVGTGRVPGGMDVHPYAIATSLVQPSAISLWSALSHHGLTTQVPRIVTATTPKKVTTPSMREIAGSGNERTARARHTWVVGHAEIEFVTVRRDRFFGLEDVWIDQQFKVPVMDRERTIIDLMVFPRVFGGLDTALATLDEHWQTLDMPRLVEYAIRYDSKAVVGRLGWCLEEIGATSDALERLRLHTGPGQQLLDPTRPAHGRRNSRWSVLDNVSTQR
jgi:predicted transcriptional regulator of viral defense system